jgi:uncharacterized protein YndB with AHSA1/START domain
MASSSVETKPVTAAAVPELVLTRRFEAPREMVYAAWTEPKHLEQWWGPKGFTNPVCGVDLRVGGKMRIDMRGPDGTVYPMVGVFDEIVPPERLVFTSGALDAEGAMLFEIRTTVTFTAEGERTVLRLEAKVMKAGPGAMMHLKGMTEGWSQSLDKLGDHVADTSAREIAATRMFDAPREVVWRMWTEREHIAKWWGPHGFTNTIHEMDVREGGAWRHTLHGPDGKDYRNESTYLEVIEPIRLVYDHGPTPVFVATVTFEARGEKTLVTMRMLFSDIASRDKTVEVFGAVEGLKQTLNRLEELLAKQ